ncbi:MAG: M23 family metallopeptidase [Moheibacter sp.]
MARKNKNIFRKLFQKHTLIILNEESQEEQFSVRLNRMNVLVILALFTFFTVAVTALTLLYTPIHGYILPSEKQVQVKDKQEILNLTDKVIELEAKAHANDIYINNLRAILAGEVPIPKIDTANQQFTTSVELDKVSLLPSEDDLKLREEVEREEMFSVSGSSFSSDTGNLLFTPLKGMVTAGYSPEENHLAIDIAAQEGEAIKSVAAGTVIFTDWTADTGYVAVIQHGNGMLSVYKHNLTVYKKMGDIVKKGEVISAVGNTGELTTGPHLHFELWIEGTPVDPQQYIVF